MVHDLSDRSEVVFDDERVVVNAGLVLAVTLGRRLGLEALVDAAVRSADVRGRRGRGARCSRWCTRCCSAPTASMTARSCAPAGPRRCSGTGRWRPRRSARSCARSRSGTCVSSTACSARLLRRAWAGGCRPRRRAAGDRCRLLRRRGPRPRASRAPATATRASSATTRCSRRARTPARSCTCGCARARPTRSAARCASSTSCSRASGAPARPGRSCSGPTRGSGTRRSSRACASRAAATRSASRCTRSSPRGSR